MSFGSFKRVFKSEKIHFKGFDDKIQVVNKLVIDLKS